MSPDDREVYNFDIRQMNWDLYLFDYLIGIKRFILKEDLANLPAARARLTRLKLMGVAVNAGTWALLVQLFARKRPRNQKWTMWLTGTLLTHFIMHVGRPNIKMPPLQPHHFK
jgi:fatty acyl-CoA reductase